MINGDDNGKPQKVSITADSSLTVNEIEEQVVRLNDDLRLNRDKLRPGAHASHEEPKRKAAEAVETLNKVDFGETTMMKIMRERDEQIRNGLPLKKAKRKMFDILQNDYSGGSVHDAKKLLESSALELMQMMVDKAKSGSHRALEFLLVRIFPPAKSAPIALDNIKELRTRRDVADAIQQTGEAMLRGEISPTDAKEIIWALSVIQNNLANPAAVINGSSSNLVQVQFIEPPKTKDSSSDKAS